MLELNHLLLFRKLWNMPVLFSICFYWIHVSMTNDCVSVTKTLVKRAKLMTDRYKKYIKSKRHWKDKLVSQKKLIYFPAQE